MNWKSFPLAFVVLASILKAFFLVSAGSFAVVAWVLFSSITIWICFSFWKNKKMPSYSGDFGFHEGKRLPRLIYLISTLVVFCIALWFAGSAGRSIFRI
jgi:hypothetical protein